MANFLEYNPEQGYLLPPTVRDVLGEGHLCFFVHGAVEKLDLQELEAGYSDEGHPAYHPALLLKAWLYAYALGMTSSRRLEQRIREDLAFRYLAGGAQPQAAALQRQIQAGTDLGGNGRLAVGRCAERDVDDGFELDGDALYSRGAELPLTEGVHGVGVELVVNAADELDAVDRAVAADYGVEDDFSLNVLVD